MAKYIGGEASRIRRTQFLSRAVALNLLTGIYCRISKT